MVKIVRGRMGEGAKRFRVSGFRLADEVVSGNNATLYVKSLVFADAVTVTQNNRKTTE